MDDMNDILNEKPAATFKTFLALCESVQGIDRDNVERAAKMTLDAIDDNWLQTLWYDSLKIGKPQVSLYATDYYAGESWACWQLYSRRYLSELRKRVNEFGVIRCAVDLGCGIGYSTTTESMIVSCAMLQLVERLIGRLGISGSNALT